MWRHISMIQKKEVHYHLFLLFFSFQSNTFQVVLVGSDEYTFAIFNYYKMEIPFTEHQLVRTCVWFSVVHLFIRSFTH